jgi:hypothetical protein
MPHHERFSTSTDPVLQYEIDLKVLTISNSELYNKTSLQPMLQLGNRKGVDSPARNSQYCLGKRNNSSTKPTPLPKSFSPGRYDVICARGKLAQESEGNRLLRHLVKNNLEAYSDSDCRFEKSSIVSSIIEAVRQASSSGGGFVKLVEEGWVQVSDRHAREKVGQMFRDYLHMHYKSSTKAKARKVRQTRAANGSDNSSVSTGTVSSFSDQQYETATAVSNAAAAPSVVSWSSSNDKQNQDSSDTLIALLSTIAKTTPSTGLPPTILCMESLQGDDAMKLVGNCNSGRKSNHDNGVELTGELLCSDDCLDLEPRPIRDPASSIATQTPASVQLFDLSAIKDLPDLSLEKISEDNISEVCSLIFNEYL